MGYGTALVRAGRARQGMGLYTGLPQTATPGQPVATAEMGMPSGAMDWAKLLVGTAGGIVQKLVPGMAPKTAPAPAAGTMPSAPMAGQEPPKELSPAAGGALSLGLVAVIVGIIFVVGAGGKMKTR